MGGEDDVEQADGQQGVLPDRRATNNAGRKQTAIEATMIVQSRGWSCMGRRDLPGAGCPWNVEILSRNHHRDQGATGASA
jgi:hypothetical protein